MASSREEAKFMRGETGVDGAAVKEEADATEVEQAKAREALLRGRTWLGRECLTWLLWRSESTEALMEVDRREVSVVFNGRLTLRAGQGDVTELSVKGVTAPYATLVKAAIAKGLLVHSAKLQITWGEQVFDVGLDAEFFDLKSAKLPALLQEEEAEKLIERLDLAGKLSALLSGLIDAFVKVRLSRAWDAQVVPELIAWATEGGAPRSEASRRTEKLAVEKVAKVLPAKAALAKAAPAKAAPAKAAKEAPAMVAPAKAAREAKEAPAKEPSAKRARAS